MIDGAIMAVELGLFVILLLKVWRIHARGEEEGGGFFAYRLEKRSDLHTKDSARAAGGPPHA